MAAHQRDGHSSQAEKNIRRSTPGLVRTSMAGDRRFRLPTPAIRVTRSPGLAGKPGRNELTTASAWVVVRSPFPR